MTFKNLSFALVFLLAFINEAKSDCNGVNCNSGYCIVNPNGTPKCICYAGYSGGNCQTCKSSFIRSNCLIRSEHFSKYLNKYIHLKISVIKNFYNKLVFLIFTQIFK